MRPMLAPILALLLTAPARAAAPAVLLGPDLDPRPIRLQSLRNGELTYLDAQRVSRTARLDDFLQVRLPTEPAAASAPPAPAPAPAPAPGSGLADLELTDGQCLRGHWAGAANPQALRWRHALLGDLTIPLDRVRAVTLNPAAAPAPTPGAAPGADQLTLANGDRLEGFLSAIRNDAVEFQPQGQPDKLVLPLTRLRALRLANPAPQPPATAPAAVHPGAAAHLLVLTDGTRLRAADLAIDQDRLSFLPLPLGGEGRGEGGPAATQPAAATAPALATSSHHQITRSPHHQIPLSQLRRLEITSRAGRLIDLADLPMTVTAGGEAFGVKLPPRAVGAALWLHAPVTVEFALPPGAQRFAARAEQAADLPTSDAPAPAALSAAATPEGDWADFLLLLHSDGKLLARERLNARQPSARLNLPLSGQTLTLQLDPATSGPVLDRLWLREAVVLVK